jgi:NAD(P)-dependent dehydrogenase (short-subunit alcohol dehydrogenase family)
MSLRRGSVVQPISKEVPWDIFDRLLLPLLFCHSAAIIISGLLHLLQISHITSFSLFIVFSLGTAALVLFYHNLQVSASGKAVLVTGCENPLAWYLCKKLDDLGFTVFAGFKEIADNADAELLKDDCSARLKLVQIDVTSEKQMLEASLFINENLPENASGLWALAHCDNWAAIGELEWIPTCVIRKAIDINIIGTARLTQIMLPLIRRANGRVIFLSSALAKIYSPVRGLQSAIHAAIENLAICLRSELKPRKVSVSVVAAGEFTSGTAWLDDESLLDQAKLMWKNMSEAQKDIYDERYFEYTIRSLEKFTKTSADLTPAIHTMIDAIMRTFPLPRYTPVTKEEKLQIMCAEYLPSAIYEMIFR